MRTIIKSFQLFAQIWLLTIFNLNLSAQIEYPSRPYVPNTWEQIKPIWYETHHVDAFKTDVCDGYNCLFINFNTSSQLIGKYLYSTFQNITLNDAPLDAFIGGYIEKRDIETGKVTWSSSYNLYQDSFTNRQEAIKNFVVSDQNIELYNLKRGTEYGVNDPYTMLESCRNARFVKRKYNINSDKYHYQDTDFNDTTRSIMNTKLFPQVGQSQLFPISANRITYVTNDVYNDYNDYTYVKFDIDSFGRRISPIDSFILPSKNSFYNLERISDSLYIVVSSEENYITIFQLDQRFKVLKKATSLNLGVNLKGTRVEKISSKFIAFRFNYGDLDVKKYEIFKLDIDANLIGRWKYPVDRRFSNILNVIDFETTSDIYLANNMTYSDSNGARRNSLVILKSNIVGSFDIIKEEKQVDRSRSIQASTHAQILPNGNVILGFEEWAYNEVNDEQNFAVRDGNAKALSYACFTQDELGIKLPSSTQDVGRNTKVTIYPNPTYDYLYIDVSEAFFGTIRLIDLNGKIWRQLSLGATTSIGIETSHLPSGMYIVQMLADDHVVYHNKFIKL